MESLKNNLLTILRQRFPGCELDLDENYLPGRIGGKMIWAGFEGVETLPRQEMIDEAVGRVLPAAEARKVAIIYAFTPDEMAAILED